MAKGKSKHGKKRAGRTRKMRGGGWGFTGSSSFPGQAGTVSNAMVYTGIGDCRAVKPDYQIPYSQIGASLKGLPGMSGGGKKNRSRRMHRMRTKKHKQRGGRYGFFPESASTVTPNGAAWWGATYGPVQRIGCEGGSPNPLNPTHTGSSAPPGAVNPNYYLNKQAGGAQNMAPASVGVGDVDSMYYYAPTAGYANTASTWRDSVGAPVQIQVPFAARAMNQACLTTGGPPPLTGALQKGGRRSRKQRGGVWPFNAVVETVRGYLPGASSVPETAIGIAVSEWDSLPEVPKQPTGLSMRRGSSTNPPAVVGYLKRRFGEGELRPDGTQVTVMGKPYYPVPSGYETFVDEKDKNRLKLRKIGSYLDSAVVTPSAWKRGDHPAISEEQAGYYGLVYSLPTVPNAPKPAGLPIAYNGGRRHKKSKSRKHRKSHKGRKH